MTCQTGSGTTANCAAQMPRPAARTCATDHQLPPACHIPQSAANCGHSGGGFTARRDSRQFEGSWVSLSGGAAAVESRWQARMIIAVSSAVSSAAASFFSLAQRISKANCPSRSRGIWTVVKGGEGRRFRGMKYNSLILRDDGPPNPSFSSPNIGDFSRRSAVPTRSGCLI